MSIMQSSKFLSDDEFTALQDLLNKHKCRDSLMLRLLSKYGMRAGELLGVRAGDIRLDSRIILIKGTKGSRDREFPLSDEMFSELKELVQGCVNSDEKIFKIKYNRLGDIWRYWRPCVKPLHALRHTAAVRYYKQTKDIQLVKSILGHVSINTTMIYTDFVYTQEAYRDVFL